MLASVFVVGAANALRNSDVLAPKAEPVTDTLVGAVKKAVPQVPLPDDPQTLVRINAAVQLVAAAALATGRAPRSSAFVLAASLVPTTVAGHRFWDESDPAAKKQHQLHFFKNVSVLGGLLIAAGDTDGRPGVAWRARRAAKDARREAKHLRSVAKAKVG
jgi:uncharacterized membrane protein YphA (DoxX/SURF4 family)